MKHPTRHIEKAIDALIAVCDDGNGSQAINMALDYLNHKLSEVA